MSNILKISEAASLALHTTVILAANPNRLVSTKKLASQLHASEAHLSKVLQRLEKADIVNSTRGP
jgi:DNA-binding IscR family transcriptional regulator